MIEQVEAPVLFMHGSRDRVVPISHAKKLFEKCHVTWEECPDLTKAPFNLAASGLCGHPSIADIGSVSNLSPIPNRTKIYTFEQIARIVTADDDNDKNNGKIIK